MKEYCTLFCDMIQAPSRCYWYGRNEEWVCCKCARTHGHHYNMPNKFSLSVVEVPSDD